MSRYPDKPIDENKITHKQLLKWIRRLLVYGDGERYWDDYPWTEDIDIEGDKIIMTTEKRKYVITVGFHREAKNECKYKEVGKGTS